jgi:PAS domain S-box-containing protein/putative nucleotidyltransferase with HDIG domain
MADHKLRKMVIFRSVLGKSRVDAIMSSFYRATKADYCFVGIIADDGSHIKTLSILENGKNISNILYPLSNSACRSVIKKRVKTYKKYGNRFCPDDPYLQHWGIHGFVGYPLLDSRQNIVGVLAAFYKEAIEDTEPIIEKMKHCSGKLVRELEKENRKEFLGNKSERFEYLLRNSRDIILIIDITGKVIYCAPSNFSILGRNDQEAIGLNIFDLIHPDDIPAAQKIFKSVARKSGSVANIQVRAKHSNGQYICLDGSITNLTKEPSIRGLVVNYTDITDRVKVSADLTRNERRFRTLMERSHDCVILIDSNNKCIYYSPSITKMLGYTPEELIGTNADYLRHPDEVEQQQQLVKEMLRSPNKPITYQARFRAKDGSWKWIEAIATNLLGDPDVRANVINFKDITERKHTEEKLKVSERTFREFLEAVNLATMIIDTEGRVEFVNDYLLSLTGNTRETVIGDSFFTQFLDPDAGINDTFRSGIRTGQIPQHFEAAMKTNKGTSRLIAWNTSIIKSITGEVTGFACLGEDITEFRKNEERVHLQVQRVSALHAIDVVISSSFDARIVFSVIVDQLMKQMGVDAVSINTYDPVEKKLTCVIDRGFNFPDKKLAEVSLSESHSAMAVLERQTVCQPDENNKELEKPKIFEQEGFIVGYSTPMTIKGQVKGVVEVFNRTPLEPDPGWMEFYETLAGQAAIAIENEEMFQRLERALADLTSAYDSTLEGWVKALDLRDKETIGHTQRVAMTVVRFALELGVSGDDLVNIRRGALLHDIGKMGIPDEILNKAGPLTEEERLIIQRHPQYAYELLQPIQYLRSALDIPYAHHERWDGQGYPRGLKGEEIPMSARIFSVVDVWDALGSNRSYREKWDPDRMVAYLEEQSGKKFDPSIVKVFIDLYKRKLI